MSAPTFQEMMKRRDDLKNMGRALDELSEAVTVLLNEYESALDEQTDPWWPDFQSEALRSALSNWSIWVPALRALDHQTNQESNATEEA